MKETKKILHKQLREFLSVQAYAYRKQCGWSQERMAESLLVSPSYYIEQEHGTYGFSSLSMTCFIAVMSEEEAIAFVKKLRALFEGRKRGDE